MPEPADASRGASRRSPGMMVAMSPLTDLVAATQGLYAGAPSDFVAHRDALAKQLRASGDRALAAAVKGLRRPSLGAWYLNVASRDGLTSLQEWLRLGRRLRAAHAGDDVDTLRTLAAQRSPLEARVLNDIAAHLAHLGVPATPGGLDEVRTTLRATLADPTAEAAVSAGRLDRSLTYSGFGPVELPATTRAREAAPEAAPAIPRQSDAEAIATQGPEPGPTTADLVAAERARQAEDREQAGRDLAAAEAALVALTADRIAAEANRKAAGDTIESLTLDLSRAHDAFDAAEQAVQALLVEEAALKRRVDHARSR